MRTTEILTSVFIESPNEIYAGGHMGTVFEGSLSGLFPISRLPRALQGDLSCIGKWEEELWVGAGELGLFRRIGTSDRFEQHAELDPRSLDVRWTVLMAGHDVLMESLNGQDFTHSLTFTVLKHLGSRALGDV